MDKSITTPPGLCDLSQIESPYTKLPDRILWYDGDETISAKELTNRVLSGKRVTSHTTVSKMTSDIQRYNDLVDPDERITVKVELRPVSVEWNIPHQYRQMDIVALLEDRLAQHLQTVPTSQHKLYVRTFSRELKLYQRHNLLDFLRMIHYVVDQLTEQKKVWGIGRGSSVSSFILFLIKAHDVDSVKYDLDIHDFLREE